MAIVDKKRELYAKLSAISALSKVPKQKVNSSISSMNNQLNSSEFLIELATVLVGAKVIKDYVVDAITNRLPDFELAIKDNLKKELKEVVSCGVNASIPEWFQSGGSGVELKIPNIDFYDLMKTDPTSFAGELIYSDTSSGLASKDFNTYLYYTIQTPTTTTVWGSSVNGVDILESTFFESTIAATGSPSRNNIIKYTASPTYSNKTLPDFNNDFIDSLSLFGNPSSLDSPKFITLIMEELFGSVSSSSGVGKSKKQIKKELEVKEVLNCILNSEDGNITDNFFTFDNETLAKIDRESNNRKNGIRELQTCDNLAVQISLRDVSNEISTILSATTKSEESKAIEEALDNLAQIQANFSSNNVNKGTIKNNFFIEIIKKLQLIFMSTIITPEFISVFAINHQIIYGKGSSYDGPIDFIRKNKKLVTDISLIVLDMLLRLLLNLVLLYITIRLKQKFADDEIEKAKNYVIALLSYTGVPPEIITQLSKINTNPFVKG
tara:strand:- start:46636 stop:48120 length:1485 start_codon:yes stop_codon:yes gene_type:complete